LADPLRVRVSGHSQEQIVRKLREADRLLAEGADLDAICRHMEASVQTYQRWRGAVQGDASRSMWGG
jgi:hypothetical protein